MVALSEERLGELTAAINAGGERPRTLEPPWVLPAELASVLLAGPADRAARLWHRRFFTDAEEAGRER